MPEGTETEFDRSRAGTIRRRARLYVLVMAVLWIPLMLLVDPLNFGSTRGGLWARLPTLAGMVAMVFYLRRRRSRWATELAVTAAFSFLWITWACVVVVCAPDCVTSNMLSIVMASMATAVGLLLSWQSTAVFCLVANLAMVAGGLLRNPRPDATYFYLVSTAFVVYPLLVLGAASRDRWQRSELDARGKLKAANEQLQLEQEARSRLFVRERTAAVDRQREDFLMELHDGVCGRLARAVVVLDRMAAIHAGDKALEGAVLAVREGLAEARGLLTVLGTGNESWDDVVAQLRWESASACERAGVELEFTTEAGPVRPLSLAAAATHALRRIASEGITNAIRHGAATRVRVHLQGRAEEVRVRVEDNGRGNGITTHLGHGLSTVRRRAGRLDGGASFSNGPEGGFVLEAWLRPDATGGADRVRN